MGRKARKARNSKARVWEPWVSQSSKPVVHQPPKSAVLVPASSDSNICMDCSKLALAIAGSSLDDSEERHEAHIMSYLQFSASARTCSFCRYFLQTINNANTTKILRWNTSGNAKWISENGFARLDLRFGLDAPHERFRSGSLFVAFCKGEPPSMRYLYRDRVRGIPGTHKKHLEH